MGSCCLGLCASLKLTYYCVDSDVLEYLQRSSAWNLLRNNSNAQSLRFIDFETQAHALCPPASSSQDAVNTTRLANNSSSSSSSLGRQPHEPTPSNLIYNSSARHMVHDPPAFYPPFPSGNLPAYGDPEQVNHGKQTLVTGQGLSHQAIATGLDGYADTLGSPFMPQTRSSSVLTRSPSKPRVSYSSNIPPSHCAIDTLI